MTKIIAISDTHTRHLDSLPKPLLAEIGGADIVVHCGDYTHLSLLDELRNASGRFVGVYGNVDSIDIRREVPRKTVFDVEGRRIGVIHPHWGGAPFGIEDAIVKEFPGADIILYGHTHDARYETRNGVALVNPGQAYADDTARATAGLIKLAGGGMEIEIVSF